MQSQSLDALACRRLSEALFCHVKYHAGWQKAARQQALIYRWLEGSIVLEVRCRH